MCIDENGLDENQDKLEFIKFSWALGEESSREIKVYELSAQPPRDHGLVFNLDINFFISYFINAVKSLIIHQSWKRQTLPEKLIMQKIFNVQILSFCFCFSFVLRRKMFAVSSRIENYTRKRVNSWLDEFIIWLSKVRWIHNTF